MDTPYEELGPTPSLPTTVVPLRRSAPASIKKLILELGLRYRPLASDQLEAYQAKLAALTADVADLPPKLLERAIAEWVRESPYLPKASDLILRAKAFTAPPSGTDRDSRENAERLAAKYNARLLGEGKRHIVWIVDEQNALKLESA
jgi:hypothetical protein